MTCFIWTKFYSSFQQAFILLMSVHISILIVFSSSYVFKFTIVSTEQNQYLISIFRHSYHSNHSNQLNGTKERNLSNISRTFWYANNNTRHWILSVNNDQPTLLYKLSHVITQFNFNHVILPQFGTSVCQVAILSKAFFCQYTEDLCSLIGWEVSFVI